MSEIGLSMIEAGKVVRAKDARLQNVFNYVPSLDGWRGIAVLGVVWFHSFGSGLNSSTIWAKVARRGYLGVDNLFCHQRFSHLRKAFTGNRTDRHHLTAEFLSAKIFPHYASSLVLSRSAGTPRSGRLAKDRGLGIHKLTPVRAELFSPILKPVYGALLVVSRRG